MGLIKVQIDTKDILGMQNGLKKVINYLEYIKQDVLSEDNKSAEGVIA